MFFVISKYPSSYSFYLNDYPIGFSPKDVHQSLLVIMKLSSVITNTETNRCICEGLGVLKAGRYKKFRSQLLLISNPNIIAEHHHKGIFNKYREIVYIVKNNV